MLLALSVSSYSCGAWKAAVAPHPPLAYASMPHPVPAQPDQQRIDPQDLGRYAGQVITLYLKDGNQLVGVFKRSHRQDDGLESIELEITRTSDPSKFPKGLRLIVLSDVVFATPGKPIKRIDRLTIAVVIIGAVLALTLVWLIGVTRD